MSRIPSKPSVCKILREAGFQMDAIIEQGRGRIEIGYLTDGVVKLADVERTEQSAIVAEELLGWGGYRTGYGSWVLTYGYESDTNDFNSPFSRHHY